MVPLRLPVKRGKNFIGNDEISATQRAESHWDLTAAGMVKGASSYVMVTVTYKISGHFDHSACGFKLDVIEAMHYSEGKNRRSSHTGCD
jgi:hypothetical protein